MGVQKHRRSPSAVKLNRYPWKSQILKTFSNSTIMECEKCGYMRRLHHICKKCGFYYTKNKKLLLSK